MDKKFSLRDLIYISLLASIATVSKIPVRALSTFLTSSIGLPAGIIGGVYYMFWIVAACGIVGKKGTATLFCIIQIFITLCISDMSPIMLVTYLSPGLAIDFFLLFWRKPQFNKKTMIIQGALANSAGAVTSALVIMNIPMAAVMVAAIIAMFSGAAGGLLAFFMVLRLKGLIPCN